MKFITTPNELKERNEKIKVKLLFLNEVKEAPLAGQPKRMKEWTKKTFKFDLWMVSLLAEELMNWFGFLFLSFGGLWAAQRPMAPPKGRERKEKTKLMKSIHKERERSWFAEWEEPMKLNKFIYLIELARQWKQINKWSTKQQQLRGKPKTANQQFLFFRVELWAQEEKRVALLAAVVGAELNY